MNRCMSLYRAARVHSRDLGIKKLSKPGIVHHALEVVVGARLKPILWIQFDGAGQIFEAILGAASHRVQQRESVESIVCTGIRRSEERRVGKECRSRWS